MQLGPYEILDCIGKGGAAKLYRARLRGIRGFEKTVAIKVLSDKKEKAKFVREAHFLSKLTHPNIVEIFNFKEHEGMLYIVMEHCDLDAKRLLEIRKSGRLIPEGAILLIAKKMLLALAHAHAAHVIHRDVSPANILLTKTGEVKLADFGIGCKTSKGDIEDKIWGKCRYLAPERLKGEVISGKSDLFSLGVVLYELLLGKELFSGKNDTEILDKIEAFDEAEWKKISTKLADFPHAGRIIPLMLIANQTERSSAEELLGTIESGVVWDEAEFATWLCSFTQGFLEQNITHTLAFQRTQNGLMKALNIAFAFLLLPLPGTRGTPWRGEELALFAPSFQKLEEGQAFLDINAIPWASVRVDGTNLGSTPLLGLMVTTGPHLLELQRVGREQKRVSVFSKKDAKSRVIVRFIGEGRLRRKAEAEKQ